MPNKQPPKDKQFKPGQSGNPKGKAKGTLSFKTIIKKWAGAELDEVNPETGITEKMTLADIITLKQFLKARRGDTRAYEILKNHIEALPKAGLDITTDGESINGKEIVFKRYKKDADKP